MNNSLCHIVVQCGSFHIHLKEVIHHLSVESAPPVGLNSLDSRESPLTDIGRTRIIPISFLMFCCRNNVPMLWRFYRWLFSPWCPRLAFRAARSLYMAPMSQSCLTNTSWKCSANMSTWSFPNTASSSLWAGHPRVSNTLPALMMPCATSRCRLSKRFSRHWIQAHRDVQSCKHDSHRSGWVQSPGTHHPLFRLWQTAGQGSDPGLWVPSLLLPEPLENWCTSNHSPGIID